MSVFRIKALQSRALFFLSCVIFFCPNFMVFTKFTRKIKPQSLNHPSLHMQKLRLTGISVKHLNLQRILPVFTVNNLNGCLKGWSRRETVDVTLCCFQRPAKCAWLCGEKGNNFWKKGWSDCVELRSPVLLEGRFLFSSRSLLESFAFF